MEEERGEAEEAEVGEAVGVEGEDAEVGVARFDHLCLYRESASRCINQSTLRSSGRSKVPWSEDEIRWILKETFQQSAGTMGALMLLFVVYQVNQAG